MFKEQVLRCWKKPYGGLEAARFEVEFNIKLKRDGSLEAMPVAVSSASSPYQRVFLESGLRAILECAPYRLPPAFFTEWQAFIPVFDNRDQ
jgi:colicin import membrane protein